MSKAEHHPIFSIRFFILFHLLAAVIFLPLACDTGDSRILPSYTGRPGEILGVLSNELYEGQTGKVMKAMFKQDMKGIPQSEPLFEMNTVPPESFSSTFRTYLNILNLVVDDSREAGIYFQKDQWAKQQMVATVVGPNDQAIADIMRAQQEKLIYFFQLNDRKRLLNGFVKDTELMALCKEKFDLNMFVPIDFRLAVDTADFAWFRHETAETSTDLVVIRTSYKDTADFSVDSILTTINTRARRYIPGPTPGSYFNIATDIPVQETRFSQHQAFGAVELRGLWHVEGDFMGGPYVSFTQLDPSGKNLITVMGFVYAPKFKKREYVLKVDALLYSARYDSAVEKEKPQMGVSEKPVQEPDKTSTPRNQGDGI
ncbi:MAG: DUF4837 family protein [Flavobacteriales bacterium]|nr:DUF4837 family protein [Flavobacteriales bacterium]MCB9449656.1 DUF4837 family protein [Flavobacteriales bacterium]